jgi:hypothetical protein
MRTVSADRTPGLAGFALLALASLLVACTDGAPDATAPTTSAPAALVSTSRAGAPTGGTGAPAGFSLVLGRPTGSSVTASVLSPVDEQLVLAIGTVAGAPDRRVGPVPLQAGVPKNVEITGLRPDTTYHYSVALGGVASPEHRFHTARATGSTFTFTIDADPHNRDPNFSGELYATTLRNVVAGNPDFHINLGDTFMTEKAKPASFADAAATFTEMRPYFGISGPDVPLYLVNGNHEGELGWLLPRGTARELPIWSTQLRQAYYPNPVPGGFYTGASAADATLGSPRDAYYAWTWGDALFIVLDPFWYTADKPRAGTTDTNWGWTLGRQQYDWLRATLDASRAANIFVFVHHLVGGGEEARGGIEVAGLFEWGGKNADGTDGFAAHRPGWGVPIHQLLVDHHVSAVFHGHDHVFVKQDLDGIVYHELPQPSVAQYDNTRLAADYGYTHGDVLGSSGHLRVTVGPRGATVEYVRSFLAKDERTGRRNGQVDHRYTIPARP